VQNVEPYHVMISAYSPLAVLKAYTALSTHGIFQCFSNIIGGKQKPS